MDTKGNIYFVDLSNQVVRKIDTADIITTVAGNGIYSGGGGYSGDGGPATAAEFEEVWGIGVDPSQNLYIADYSANVIRKVDSAGIITTVAGWDTVIDGTIYVAGGLFAGDGPANSAYLSAPTGVAFDNLGNMFISDMYNGRIRRVDATTNIITTVSGNGAFTMGGYDYYGGSPADSVAIGAPFCVAVDDSDNLYSVPCSGSYYPQNIVFKTSAASVVSRVLGNGIYGFSGDGGIDTSCEINGVNNVALDGSGNLYIEDVGSNRIRRVDNILGLPNTIWGNITFPGLAIADSTCKVWLIQYDSASHTLTAVDSINSTSAAGMQRYEFDSKPAGAYLIKAALISAPDSGDGYIPTYFHSSQYWDSANYVHHTDGTDGYRNISMHYGTETGGPGFIGGDVYAGAGKGTSGDVPVAGMMIYLRDASNNVIAFTHTDVSGHYSFGGIANGTYTIYPEALEYTTTPSAAVTLSSSGETAGSVGFKQYTTSLTIKPITTIVVSVSAQASVSVYPNPFSNELNVRGLNDGDHIGIYNMAGQLVFAAPATGASITISEPQIAAGSYILRLSDCRGACKANIPLAKQ